MKLSLRGGRLSNLNYGNILLNILNDRFSDMGMVTGYSIDSQFNGTGYEKLDMELYLHRPLQYLNLRETLLKDTVDEWIVDIDDKKGLLVCPICNTNTLLHLSEIPRHHYCFYCGSKLGFSLEDLEEINKEIEGKK